jgi:hypothetical protein
MTSDAEAEAFLDSDLSGLDFRAFKPERFEFARKGNTVKMRMQRRGALRISGGCERRPERNLQRKGAVAGYDRPQLR